VAGDGPSGGRDHPLGGFTVTVACSTLAFARLSLEDCLRTIRELHFAKADLAIRQDGPHLTPVEVSRDVTKTVAKLKAATVAYAAIYCGEYDLSRDPKAVHFRAVCRLARLLSVPTITVRSHDVATLQILDRCCAAEGLLLAIETDAGDPAVFLDLLKAVPGMKLTLDPSYLVANLPLMESLMPHVVHVRLRDTAKSGDQFQVCVGQGDIDFGKIISHLERLGYERSLTVDIRDVADGAISVDAEVRKLKYLLESLI
jgi:sugar phosphate isomerase/epimerase